MLHAQRRSNRYQFYSHWFDTRFKNVLMPLSCLTYSVSSGLCLGPPSFDWGEITSGNAGGGDFIFSTFSSFCSTFSTFSGLFLLSLESSNCNRRLTYYWMFILLYSLILILPKNILILQFYYSNWFQLFFEWLLSNSICIFQLFCGEGNWRNRRKPLCVIKFMETFSP